MATPPHARDLFVRCVGSPDGVMGPEELQSVLDLLGAPAVSHQQLSAFVSQFDVDGDGEVTLADFTSAMQNFQFTASMDDDDDDDEFGDAGFSRGSRSASSGGGGGGGGMLGIGGRATPGAGVRRSSSPGRGSRESLVEWIRQVSARSGVGREELHEVLAQLDEYVQSERAAHEDELLSANAVAEQAVEAKRVLENRIAALTDDFALQETELLEVAAVRRLCEDRQNQISELQSTIAGLKAELDAAADAAGSARKAELERKRLRDRTVEQQAQMLEQLGKIHGLERELSDARADFDELQSERDGLLQEFTGVLNQLKNQGVSVEFKAGQLDQENKELREKTRELVAALELKESALGRLKSALDDQVLLVQSMTAERSRPAGGSEGPATKFHGSLMNEIENLVKEQMHADELENNTAENDGNTGDDPAVPPGLGPQPKMLLKIESGLAVSMASPIGKAAKPIHKSPLPPASPTSPARPDMPDPGSAKVSLNERLQVYAAASATHMAGRKIITPSMALGMDVVALRRTAAALQDLIDTRSTRLIEALKEREWLETDVALKNAMVKFYIDKAQTSSPAAGSPLVKTPSGGRGLVRRSSGPGGALSGLLGWATPAKTTPESGQVRRKDSGRLSVGLSKLKFWEPSPSPKRPFRDGRGGRPHAPPARPFPPAAAAAAAAAVVAATAAAGEAAAPQTPAAGAEGTQSNPRGEFGTLSAAVTPDTDDRPCSDAVAGPEILDRFSGQNGPGSPGPPDVGVHNGDM